MQTIILLHGALGATQELEPLAAALRAGNAQVHPVLFSGHGQAAFAGAFGIPQFTQELAGFIKSNQLQQPHVFGYSMGGYVALNLAAQQPQLLGKIVTLATKFNWSKETVDKETAGLDPVLMQQKIPAFANALARKHGPAWTELVLKTADLMRDIHAHHFLNPDILKAIPTKTLIGLGDRDKMVTLDETLQVYKTLPDAAMYMLPNTKHPLETADPALLCRLILDFIGRD